MQRLSRGNPQLQRSPRRVSQSEDDYLPIDDIIHQEVDKNKPKRQNRNRHTKVQTIAPTRSSSSMTAPASSVPDDSSDSVVPPQIAKVRPTYMLGAYGPLGKIWDATLQSLMVICVGILPYAIGVVLSPDIIATMTTFPLNIILLPLSIVMTTIGAFSTQIMHCELWARLTTSKPRATRTRQKRSLRQRRIVRNNKHDSLDKMPKTDYRDYI